MEKKIPAEDKNESAVQKKLTKLLKSKRKKEALDYLVNLLRQEESCEKYMEILLEEFYYPYTEIYKELYEFNRNIFEGYPYFRQALPVDIFQTDFLILKCDEEYYRFNTQNMHIVKLLYPHPKDLIETRIERGTTLFFKNYLHFRKIYKVEIENRDEIPDFPWMKDPLYLYYDNIDLFLPYLQFFNFSPLLKSQRVVFLFGEGELSDWFQDTQAVFPDVYQCIDETDEIQTKITKIYQEKEEECQKDYQKANEYYRTLTKEDLYNSIKTGKPRIVFFTSLFSTATQYYIRDIAKACDRLEIPNKVIIEQGSLFRVKVGEILKVLNEFRPDIFFMINDFRYQRPIIPTNMLYFNWAMDPYERMSYHSAEQTTDLDFILDLWITNKDSLLKRGHSEDKIIEGPIIVPDSELFREYDLSQEEQNKYACDICIFSNAGNPKEGLEAFLLLIKASPIYETLERLYTEAYEELYRKFYNEDWIYSEEEYQEFLNSYYNKFGVLVEENDIERITIKFQELVGWQITRSLPLEWLHEKGYNMKLWGRAWLNHPKLKKYAQGVAENGEKLAKVIKASKIVLGTSPGASAHPRVFETFLSGGFYLGINIPDKEDSANVRRYMEENREIVFFYSKEDLYSKVDYYLKNEQERKTIIKNAQQKIKREINYETLFPRALAEVAQKLAKQINMEQENGVN